MLKNRERCCVSLPENVKGVKEIFMKCIYTLLLAITVSLVSCEKKESASLDKKYCAITKVVGPSSTTVGNEISLDIELYVNNGCAYFSGFDEEVSNTTREIRAIQRDNSSENILCHQALVKSETVYKFKATSRGKYLLKFLSADNSIITHELIVN